MSFTKYLIETNEVNLLRTNIQEVQNLFSLFYSSLERLKATKPNEVNQMTAKMDNIGILFQQLQNVITGGGTVSNQYAIWGGPE